MTDCIFERISECLVKCRVYDTELKYACGKDETRLRRNCRSRGIGDTIKRLAVATGVDALVKKVAGPCGCKERQEKLNELFPY